MDKKIDIDVVELQKISLNKGDVLFVKIISDDLDVDNTQSLKDDLGRLFANNKVVVFMMPKGSDIKFEAVSQADSGCNGCNGCEGSEKEG